MIDYNLIFDGTPPTTGVAITTTRVSTNTIDLSIGRDFGVAGAIGLHVDVLTAFVSGGGATLQIDVEVSADNSTFYQLALSPVYPVAQLIVGAPIFRYFMPLNQALNSVAGIKNFPGRYIRLNYTVGTSTFSAGAVFAYMNAGNDRQQFYAPANNYVAH